MNTNTIIFKFDCLLIINGKRLEKELNLKEYCNDYKIVSSFLLCDFKNFLSYEKFKNKYQDKIKEITQEEYKNSLPRNYLVYGSSDK